MASSNSASDGPNRTGLCRGTMQATEDKLAAALGELRDISLRLAESRELAGEIAKGDKGRKMGFPVDTLAHWVSLTIKDAGERLETSLDAMGVEHGHYFVA